MMHDFQEIGHRILGPYRNSWGYVTTIAIFGKNDIMVKSDTPRNTRIVKRFSSWDECADFVELINSDRRY